MNKIRKVILNDRNGKGYKYIFAVVTFPDGTTQEILRGYADQENHSDILRRTENEIGAISLEAKVECGGGGRVAFPEKNVLLAYSASTDFGYPPVEKVEALLREHFNDFKIVVSTKIKLEDIKY